MGEAGMCLFFIEDFQGLVGGVTRQGRAEYEGYKGSGYEQTQRCKNQ